MLSEAREPLGVMSRNAALDMARDQAVDLVLVVPDAVPPVCRRGAGRGGACACLPRLEGGQGKLPRRLSA